MLHIAAVTGAGRVDVNEDALASCVLPATIVNQDS